MTINNVLAGIPVSDFDSALSWYERLLGRPADQRPMEGLADWSFAGTGSIQLVADSERAGGGLLTLAMDDLRRHVAAVEQRGLAFETIDDQTSQKVLFATIADPEGNGSPWSRSAAREFAPGARGALTRKRRLWTRIELGREAGVSKAPGIRAGRPPQIVSRRCCT